jgi:hypothetical protein
MAMTPEALVKKKVKAILDELKVYHFSPMQNGMGSSGVHDIICCVNAFFVTIECKKDAKTAPTALQTKHAHYVQASKGVVFLANGDNMKELTDLLNRIKEYRHGISWRSFWPFDNPAPFDEW